MTAITLNFHSVVDLTDEQFSKLCQANPDIKLERTAKGELIVQRSLLSPKDNMPVIYCALP